MTLQLANISLYESGEPFLTVITATFQAGINVLVRGNTAGKSSLMPVMAGLERAGVHSECGSKLNEERDAQYSLNHPGAPYPKLAHERHASDPRDELVAGWRSLTRPGVSDTLGVSGPGGPRHPQSI